MDRKIITYSIFVIIASGLWLLNKLSNEFITTINYPVIYTNLPKDKVVVNELPAQLQLQIKSYGYNLLRYLVFPATSPLEINFKDYSFLVTNPNTRTFKLETIYEVDKFRRQMPSDMQLLGISPDTIGFMFANLIKKKIAIKPNVNLNFEQQCLLDGEIRFNPDSVTVSGPGILLDTLNAIFTKPDDFKALNKTISQSIELKVNEPFRLNINEVMMTIPVAKFTQSIIEVPITVAHVPDSMQMLPFPRVAKVSYMVSLNNYHKIGINDFIVEIDYDEIKNMIGQKLPVKLILSPEDAKSVMVNPSHVEYIIERKPW